MKHYLLLGVLVLFLNGCGNDRIEHTSGSAVLQQPLPLTTIIQTSVSGRETGKDTAFKVIQDTASLLQFFPKIEKAKADSIDFSKDTVIAVCGGDAIRITAIEPGEGGLNVNVLVSVFSKTNPFYNIPYSPLHMVRIDRTDLAVTFHETVETKN
jgi:hypothetical protein